MRERIEGLIAAPFTPMAADGEVNLAAIEAYAELLARSAVVGVFVCGTTGEGVSLTASERMAVARQWTDLAPEGLRVIVHVGQAGLADSRALAAHAQEIGAWGIGAMGPCFYRPRTVEDLVAYCAEVAAAAPELPFYYYHIPSMTGVTFAMVDFLEAAGGRIASLAGIKFTHDDLMDYDLCRRHDGGRYDILFGRDELLLCGLALGAVGAVGSTYNYAAPLYRRIIEAFESGDMCAARELQHKSMEMVRSLLRASGDALASGKAVMKMVGVDCGPVRLPNRPLTPQAAERLRADLEKIGFAEFCSG